MAKKGEHLSEEARNKLRAANIGKHPSEETLKKMRKPHKHFSEETRKKMSESAKHRSSDHLKKMSEARKKAWQNPEYRKKVMNTITGLKKTEAHVAKMRRNQLGKRPSENTRKKMSEGRRGEKNPFYGKHLSEKARLKLRGAQLGKHPSEETRKVLREIGKKHWEDPKYVEKARGDNWHKGLHSKTRPESRTDMLLQQLYPGEWAYNGRGQGCITIGRLTPDFINVKGEKKVIDVHGDYWHRNEKHGTRAEAYAKHGYSSLIIWEKELKDIKQVIQKIVEFIGKEPHLSLDDS
jgi:G:T-mismatch repair DNA endonuclease (very short patch repair protein)